MGRVSCKRRKMVLHQKRLRKNKLKKLRQRLATAKSGNEKEKLVEKALRLTPWLSKEEFLKPNEKKDGSGH